MISTQAHNLQHQVQQLLAAVVDFVMLTCNKTAHEVTSLYCLVLLPQVCDLGDQLTAVEAERTAAVTQLAELRRELAEKQLALTAAQDAAAAVEAQLAEAQQQVSQRVVCCGYMQ